MKFFKFFKNSILLGALVLATFISSSAQTLNLPVPRENKLLNGAKLIVWNDKKSDKISVKIRIHSGAAFDPLGKEGTMQLLSDILFPTDSTKDFFTEDLNGNFEIVTNYDFIQINASGDADKFLTILETLAPVVTNPTINKELTEKVRLALLEKVSNFEKNPSYVAERAAAKQLYGNYPYGRPSPGTSQSLAKIDFADLLLAEQKFFTADNATIAINGNVNPDFALRAVKRLFGGWIKSDKKVPATFAQPDAPSSTVMKISMSDIDKVYTVTAIDTVGRADKDYWANQILTRIWKQKYCYSDENSRFGDLKYEPHFLRGIYFLRKIETPNANLSVNNGNCAASGSLTDGKSAITPIKQTEFDAAKQSISTEFQQRTQSAGDLIDLWLDADTYKLSSAANEFQTINSVTLADVQKADEKMRKQSTVVISLSNNSSK